MLLFQLLSTAEILSSLPCLPISITKMFLWIFLLQNKTCMQLVALVIRKMANVAFHAVCKRGCDGPAVAVALNAAVMQERLVSLPSSLL